MCIFFLRFLRSSLQPLFPPLFRRAATTVNPRKQRAKYTTENDGVLQRNLISSGDILRTGRRFLNECLRRPYLQLKLRQDNWIYAWRPPISRLFSSPRSLGRFQRVNRTRLIPRCSFRPFPPTDKQPYLGVTSRLIYEHTLFFLPILGTSFTCRLQTTKLCRQCHADRTSAFGTTKRLAVVIVVSFIVHVSG